MHLPNSGSYDHKQYGMYKVNDNLVKDMFHYEFKTDARNALEILPLSYTGILLDAI